LVEDYAVKAGLALFKSLSLGLKPDNLSEKEVITRFVRDVGICHHEGFMGTEGQVGHGIGGCRLP